MADNLNNGAAEPQQHIFVAGTPPAEGDGGVAGVGRLNHATVRGTLDPVMLQQRFTLAIGPNCHSKRWSNVTSTGKEVLDLFTTFEVGPKDGTAILQGSVAKDGGERNKANQHTNYLVMLDDDTGAPIAETVAEIERQGLRAIVYTTHSHGRPETEVNCDQLITWMRAQGRNDEPTAKDAGDFLNAKKNTHLEVFADGVLDPPQHGEKGTYQLLRHRPMARKRIVLLLEKPFVFGHRGGLHKEAMVEWAERYAGAAQQIGVAYDHSCVDPCRLLYTPRVPPDAKFGDGPFDHQIVVIWGDKSLDLDAVERVSTKRKSEKEQRASSSAQGDSRDGRFSDIKDFLPFLKIVGGDWDALQWWTDIEPDEENWCPWHGIHTRETDKEDTGFKIWGPDENENGWNCQCSHGCGKDPERGARDDGKQDRAKFLYAKAIDAGVTDADELVPYITNPDVEAKWRAYREKGKEKAEKRATWDEAETLGTNENRMLALVGRLNKQMDGAKHLEKYAELKVITEVIQKRKGKKVKVVRKLPAPPYVVSLAPRRTLDDKTLAEVKGRCETQRVRLAEMYQYIVKGEPRLARRVLAEIKRQKSQGVVARIMRAQATRDMQTDAEMLAVLKEALGDNFNKTKMGSRLSELRHEYQSKDAKGLVSLPEAPVAGQEGYVDCVRGEWDHESEQVRVAIALFERNNERVPGTVYCDAENEYARINTVGKDGAKIERLEPDSWVDAIGPRVTYRMRNSFTGRDEGLPVPFAIVQRIRGKADLKVPRIEQIIKTPIFDRTGQLHTQRGYVPGLEAYLDPRGDFLPVSKAPTTDEVQEALALFEESIYDFPFSDYFDGSEKLPYKLGVPGMRRYRETNWKRGLSSRWNTIAAILHPQMWHLMPEGCSAPGYHLDKSVPGEGAGLLMNTINLINNGTVMPIRTYSDRNSEFEVSITSSLRSGDNIIAIDNITGVLRSDALAAMFTAGEWVTRKFGDNEKEIRIRTRAMWILGGNNVEFGEDLVQRMVPIRLDSGIPDPAKERSERAAEFFRYADQAAWLRAERPRLVQAAHTIIAAWFAAGQPRGRAVHPRYPEYSAVMGGILENAAEACNVECKFLANLGAYRAQRSDDADVATTWMQKCFTKHGYGSMTAGDMVSAVKDAFGNLSLEIPLEIDREGALRDPKKAKQQIKDTVLRKTFELDTSKWDAEPRLKLRLVPGRERSPATYRFLSVSE